jgi:hypothetical protein
VLLQCHRDDIESLIEDRIGLEQVPHALSAVLAGQVLKFVVAF